MFTLVKKHGFTLVEVMIALFIFTIVALILSQSLHSLIKSQACTESSAGQRGELQKALLYLTRDLEQALDRPISLSGDSKEAAFVGKEGGFCFTHLGFVTPSDNLAHSRLQRSCYQVEKGELFRSTWLTLDRSTEGAHQRRLLSGLKQVQFSYLDQGKHFHAQWPLSGNKAALPRALSVKIEFVEGGSLEQIYLLPQQEVPNERR